MNYILSERENILKSMKERFQKRNEQLKEDKKIS